MKKLLLVSTILFLILCGSAYTYYQKVVNEPFSKKVQNFKVNSGDRIDQVAERLSYEGLISSYAILKIHSRLTQKAEKLKIGTYIVPEKSSINDILNLLTSGKTQLIKVTIPEGKNLFEIAQILEKKEITQSANFVKTAKNMKSIDLYDHSIPNIEGHLYPETYYFSKEMEPADVIQIMINQYKKMTSQLEKNKFNLSPYEVLILASIVEKETGKAFERKRIAGVFHNRLKKKMRIQSDPTIIYGIFEKYDGNIRRSDIRTPTPYNTYTLKRLPIGAISNPGIEAIKAVLDPEEHNYLYFVSKNDGTHTFSKTYTEHKKKVYEYQIRKRK